MDLQFYKYNLSFNKNILYIFSILFLVNNRIYRFLDLFELPELTSEPEEYDFLLLVLLTEPVEATGSNRSWGSPTDCPLRLELGSI
jgi:hypothetical protein